MPATVKLKKRKLLIAVLGVGMALAVSLIPYDTHGREGYIPLGAVLLMFALEIFRMIDPRCYFFVLGAVATLIIERLIGLQSKPPRWW
jgi:hypothetical protein